MAGMDAGRELTFLWWAATLFCRAPNACRKYCYVIGYILGCEAEEPHEKDWVRDLKERSTAFCAAGIFAPTAAKSTAEAVMRAAIVSERIKDAILI